VPFLKDIELLLQKKYEIKTAVNGQLGLNYLRNENFTAILLDIKMPVMNGLDVLRKMKEEFSVPPPVIIVSDSGEVDTVVKAMNMGAFDYIQKDFNLEILTQKINNALENNELKKKVTHLKNLVDENYDRFIFQSQVMQRVNEEINKCARLDCDILIKGETGTGKDLAAYEIYKRSKINNSVFIQLPLSSLSQNLIESELFGFEKGAFTGAEKTHMGKLELANRGTLYIPEISSIDENTQLKLLQFMQYKTINKVGQTKAEPTKLNLRLIMATNEDLEKKVSENKLRADFFYRVDAVSINLPPLRNRKEDIPLLANYFIKKNSQKLLLREIEFDDVVIDQLSNYDWPGNIRQLSNTILKAIVQMDETSSIVDASCLPPAILQHGNISGTELLNLTNYEKAKRNFKIEYFSSLLKETNGNYTKAASLAGISRNGLDKALKDIGLK